MPQATFSTTATVNNNVTVQVTQYLSQMAWVVQQISYTIVAPSGANRVGGKCTLFYNGNLVDTNPNGAGGAFGGNPPIKLYNSDNISLTNTAALKGDNFTVLVIYNETPIATLPAAMGGQAADSYTGVQL